MSLLKSFLGNDMCIFGKASSFLYADDMTFFKSSDNLKNFLNLLKKHCELGLNANSFLKE